MGGDSAKASGEDMKYIEGHRGVKNVLIINRNTDQRDMTLVV